MENGFMTVEDVLRYLGKRWLALRQYGLSGYTNHFFRCSDLKEKLGEHAFRVMECEVTQLVLVNANYKF